LMRHARTLDVPFAARANSSSSRTSPIDGPLYLHLFHSRLELRPFLLSSDFDMRS
jgi:hypothetical protein